MLLDCCQVVIIMIEMERLGWVRNDAIVVEECVVRDAVVAHPAH